MSIYSMVYLITEIFYMYILYLLIDSLLGKQRTGKMPLFLTYIFYMLVADVTYFWFQDGLWNLGLNLLFMFLITLHYETSYKKRILMVVFLYVVMALIETMVVLLTSRVSIAPGLKNNYNEIIGPILFKFVLYIFALLLKNVKRAREDVKMPVFLWISIFVIPSGSIFVTANLISSLYEHRSRMLLCISWLLLINILAFYLYDKIICFYHERMQAERIKQENVYYNNQFEEMKKHVEEVDAFRHDFKNHLEVLGSLIEGNEEAKEYLSGITGGLGHYRKFARTGNNPIDSIINYKLAKASESLVDVKVKLAIPCELEVESTDLVVILGNLLDNAINAVTKTTGERSIDFEMRYDKGVLKINISNTFSGELKYENNRLKTTAVSPRHHGYGLRNVEEVLKKYQGCYEVDHTDSIFRISTILYVKEAA